MDEGTGGWMDRWRDGRISRKVGRYINEYVGR